MPEQLLPIEENAEGTLYQVQQPYVWDQDRQMHVAGPCKVCGAVSMRFGWPTEHATHYCFRANPAALAAYDEAWE